MRIADFKAEPNASGGQIDLSWTIPSTAEFPGFKGIKILRREFTQPDLTDVRTVREIPDDSTTGPGQVGQILDASLKSGTTYYYAIIAHDAAANFSELAYASTMATGAYATAEHLYSKLPGLY